MRYISTERHGYDIEFVDMTQIENVKKYIKIVKTSLIWIETPTNPTLKLIDIEAVCLLDKENNIITVVDNTFATPYL